MTSYGWRGYAIPILLVTTVFAVLDALPDAPVQPRAQASRTPSPETLVPVPPPHIPHHIPVPGPYTPTTVPAPAAAESTSRAAARARAISALPPGGPFAANGAGSWSVVPGHTPQIGAGKQRVFRYTVEFEKGVDPADFGGLSALTDTIETTLSDKRSWISQPALGFRRIDSGIPDFRISMTSQATARRACGFEIPVDTSCFLADQARVVLSEPRWVRGANSAAEDLAEYRQYVVNHEIGHAIGHPQHEPCATDGALAPIMMQQTFSTDDDDIAALDPRGVVPRDGRRCRFNPWPFPSS